MTKRAVFNFAMILAFAAMAFTQGRTTFTGTAVIYGSGFNTRTVTRPFTMIVNGRTGPDQLSRYLNVLQDRGQTGLLDEIDDIDLGRFSLGGSVGVPLNIVMVDEEGNDLRIRAAFRRWMGFGEIRRGLRSTDYPFGYVDLRIDPRTGRGEGTFIPVAKVRFVGSNTIEVEDFGTFPGRLIGVQMRGARPPL